jgi:hypothetical protein
MFTDVLILFDRLRRVQTRADLAVSVKVEQLIIWYKTLTGSPRFSPDSTSIIRHPFVRASDKLQTTFGTKEGLGEAKHRLR